MSCEPTIASLQIIGISPSLALSGSDIFISGTNFVEGVAVYFDTIPSAKVRVKSNSSLVAKIPPLAPGRVTVVVKSDEEASNPVTFIVDYPATNPPAIASVLPESGLVGASLTIYGSNFVPGTGVFFGQQPGVNIAVRNSHSLTVEIPPLPPGPIEVQLVDPHNQASNFAQVTVLTPPPVPPAISAISPLSGFPGTSIAISGANFAIDSQVFFGTEPARSLRVISPNSITAIAPASLVHGSATVSVTSGSGNASFPIPFKIESQIPPSAHPMFRYREGVLEYWDVGSRSWKPIPEIGSPPPPLDRDGFAVMAILQSIVDAIAKQQEEIDKINEHLWALDGKAVNLDLLVALQKAQIDTQNILVSALDVRGSV